MPYLADLHTHSRFSRATSRESTLAGLFAWARCKGIGVVGSGDFTHPAWLGELREHLVSAEPGFFRLDNEIVRPALDGVSPEAIEVRFVLSAEVSSVYKLAGRVRKVHNLLFVPDFVSAQRINHRLASLGNIASDGRPILGLDARDLLEIQLEEAPEGFLVPAHVWTPWFSLFGSRSGFDSIEECFRDLADHVFALETGLSSDPAMNRLVSALDRFTLISNSDCHSPAKLGREATLFAGDFSFFGIRDALKMPGSGFGGTLEFFPEEGKYHFDGHRGCDVSLAPEETRMLNDRCPRCGRPVTVGVQHRVAELADRDVPRFPGGDPGFQHHIPLCELLGEILGLGAGTKKVMGEYGRAVSRFGSEFNLLLWTPREDLIRRCDPMLAEAVARVRRGEVLREPGYDGRFGRIRVFSEEEKGRRAASAEPTK